MQLNWGEGPELDVTGLEIALPPPTSPRLAHAQADEKWGFGKMSVGRIYSDNEVR
jgi:hypothetical protein